ncbi:endodeoxyribonuclease [Podila epigama]|nr:endodeoxyribonuclease [Podila epigama]
MREQSLHVDQEPFSQTVSRSREWVMGQQEKMVAGILLALCHRVDPECQLSARTAAPWQGYDSSKGIIRRKVSKWDPITGRKRPTKPIWFRNRSWHTAASVVKVMDLIHDNLSKEVVSSKRDIFYRDVPTFQCQRRVDVIVEDLACTFETPRSCLNVIAASRSLVYGSIRFTLEVANSELDQDNTHDPLSAQMDNVTSSTSPQAAISYTDFNTLVSVPVLERQVIRIEIHPRTRYVFVIEKEATMSYLISAGFCESHGPCILLTSKGYPDRVSRRLLKRLSDMAHVARPIPLDIPFLALVDCDPNGIDIYLTYRCGSTQSGYDNADLAVPDLQYLGQLPSDWTIGLKDSANVSSYDEEANADGQQLFNSLIPLTPRDRALLVKRLTKHPFVLATRALHVEISRMLLMNRKSELQSLCQENVRDVPADSSNSRALTPFISYLDQKLKLDPWAKRHAWRQHALFTRSTRIGSMFPGLGIASVAFAAYLGYEYVTAPKDAHHGEGHH